MELLSNVFILSVLRCEVVYFQLTPLFTYILSNFLELISNGRSESLAISDVESDKTGLSCLFCCKL